MLAVGLGKHHQLHIGGVARQAREGGHEVVNFIFGQRQAKAGVGGLQGLPALFRATGQHIDMLHGRGLQLGEQRGSGSAVGHHRFGHAVVQQGRYLTQLLGGQLGRLAQQPRLQADAVFGGALDPANGQTAVARNVGGLGSPGRQRAQTRRDDEDGAVARARIRVAVGQQGGQALKLGRRGRGVGGHQVHKACRNATDPGVNGLKGGLQLLGAKGAEGVAARQRGHVQGHGSGLFGMRERVRRAGPPASPGWAAPRGRPLPGPMTQGVLQAQPAILPGITHRHALARQGLRGDGIIAA